MTKRPLLRIPLALAAVRAASFGAAAMLAVSTIAFAAEPGDSLVLRKGKTIVQYEDEKAQIDISYRHLDTHRDTEWMLLDFYVRALGTKSFSIAREDVTLVVPGGDRLNLPTQKKLGEEFKDIRRFRLQVDISRDPLEGYFKGYVRSQPLKFFTIPGEGIVFDEVSVGNASLVFGDLYFKSPTGTWADGTYKLEIRNKDLDVSIPFMVPAPALGKDDGARPKKKDPNDTSVPW